MFDEKDLRKIHCVTTLEKLMWNLSEQLKALQADVAALRARPQDKPGKPEAPKG